MSNFYDLENNTYYKISNQKSDEDSTFQISFEIYLSSNNNNNDKTNVSIKIHITSRVTV